jgi:hypothetical protein
MVHFQNRTEVVIDAALAQYQHFAGWPWDASQTAAQMSSTIKTMVK